MTRYLTLDEAAKDLEVDKVVVDDSDLVTLEAASVALGLHNKYIAVIESRERKPGAARTLPEPRVVGDKVRLWSLHELRDWHRNRTA